MRIPEPLPDEIILKPSPKKWIGVAVIGAIFVAIGIMMISQGDLLLGWLGTLFFGAVLVTALLQLFSKATFLKLGPAGFEQRIMGRHMVCRWEDVSEFGVWGMSAGGVATNSFVSFDRREDEGRTLTTINRSISGASAMLGDNYGMKSEDLAVLMNAFRDRALRA